MTTPAAGARATAWPPGSLAPRPGAAPWPRMLLAQAALEARLTLRRGESVLLTMVIPLVLLVGGATLPLVDLPGDDGRAARLDFLVPGLLAVAVLATAFTGQAIATGFERSYGVLKRLGASPLPRSGLLAAKSLAVLAVEVLQVTALVAVGLALGWRPAAGPVGWLVVLVLLLLGTAALSALGLLLAGSLRAEAVLGLANVVFLLLLVGGGLVVPLSSFPDAAAAALGLLPTAALAAGLRTALADGGVPVADLALLVAWAAAGTVVASRAFRWE